MKTQLSDTALIVLDALAGSARGNGYDFGFSDEVDYKSLGLTRHQYAGYVSTLVTKGFIEVFECEVNGKILDGAQVVLDRSAFVILGIEDKDPNGPVEVIETSGDDLRNNVVRMIKSGEMTC